MALVKVRRDGNSLAVTIPAELARKARIEEGAYVNVDLDETPGRVLIEAVSIQPRIRPEVVRIGRKVIKEERHLLDRLAEYDGGRDKS